MTLDVFLESGDGLNREQVEEAFARHGVGADSIVTTPDGGEASVSLDEDGAVFVVRVLTRDLARVMFDVAGEAELAILPADGTPTALVVDDDTAVPDELEPVGIADAGELFEELRRSEELRATRTA